MNSRRCAMWWLVVSCLVLLFGAAHAAPSDIKDVPPGHWAYEAVRTLVNRGYLSVGLDGAFRGNEPVDRYTLASALAQVLAEIEAGKAQASIQDVQLLRKLTNEYRAELVQYYAEQQKLAEALTAGSKRSAVLDEKINETLAALGSLSSRTEALQRELASNAARDAGLAGKASALQEGVQALSMDLEQARTELAKQVLQLQSEAVALRKSLDQQAAQSKAETEALRQKMQESDDSIRQEAAALANRVKLEADSKRAQLEARAGHLEARATELEVRVGSQETRATAADQKLQAVSTRVDALGASLAAGTKSSQDELLRNVTNLNQELKALEQRMTQYLEGRASGLEKSDQDLQASLESQAANLQAAIVALEQESEAQLNQLSETRARLFALEQQGIELRQADAQNLRRQNETAAQVTSLERAQGALATDLKGAQEALKTHGAQIAEQARQQEQLQKAMADMSSVFETQLKAADQQQVGQIVQLREELIAQQKSLKAEASDRTTALRELKVDQDGLRSQAQVQSVELEKLKEEQAKSHKELGDKLSAQERTLRAEITQGDQAINATLASSMSDVRLRLGQIEALTNQLREGARITSEQFRADLSQIDRALGTQLEERMTDMETRLATDAVIRDNSLRSEIAKVSQQLAKELRGDMATIRGQLTTLAGQNQALGDDVAKRYSDLDAKLEDYASKGAGRDASLESGLQQTMAALDQLKQNTASNDLALRSEFQMGMTELGRTNSQLRQDMVQMGEQLRAGNTALDEQLAGLDAKLRQHVAALSAKDAELGKELQETITALGQLRAETATSVSAIGKQLEAALADQEKAQRQDMAESEARLQGSITGLDARLRQYLGEAFAGDAALRKQLQGEMSALQQLLRGEMTAGDQALSDQLAVLNEELLKHVAASSATDAQLGDGLQRTNATLGQLQAALADQDRALRQDMVQVSEELRLERKGAEQLLRSEMAAGNKALNEQLAGLDDKLRQYVTDLLVTDTELGKELQKTIAALEQLHTERKDAELLLRSEMMAGDRALDEQLQVALADQDKAQRQAMAESEAQLQDEITALQQSLRGEIAAGDGALNEQLAGLNAEMRQHMAALSATDARLGSELQRTNATLEQLRAETGTSVSATGEQLQAALADLGTTLRQDMVQMSEQLRTERKDAELLLRSEAMADGRALQEQLAGLDAKLRQHVAALSTTDTQLESELQKNAAALEQLRAETAASALSTVEQLQAALADQERALRQGIVEVSEQLRAERKDTEQLLRGEMAAGDEALNEQLAGLDAKLRQYVADTFAGDAMLRRQLQGEMVSLEKSLREDMTLAGEQLSSRIRDDLSASEAALRGEIAAQGDELTALEEQSRQSGEQLRAEMLGNDAQLRDGLAELGTKLSEYRAAAAQLQGEVAAVEKALRQDMALADAQLARSIQSGLSASEEALRHEMQVQGERFSGAVTDLMARDAALASSMEENATQLDAKLNEQSTRLEAAMAAIEGQLRQSDEQLRAGMTAGDDALRKDIAALELRLGNEDQGLRSLLAAEAKQAEERSAALAGRVAGIEAEAEQIQQMLNVHSESLAAQQMSMGELEAAIRSKYDGEIARLQQQNQEQAAQFGQALAALDANHRDQLDSLRQETAQLRRELDRVNSKLLTVESRMGLSDEQFEELNRRIQDGLADHLNTALARERALEKDIAALKEQYEDDQKKSQASIRGARETGLLASMAAALLGIFVQAP